MKTAIIAVNGEDASVAGDFPVIADQPVQFTTVKLGVGNTVEVFRQVLCKARVAKREGFERVIIVGYAGGEDVTDRGLEQSGIAFEFYVAPPIKKSAK